VPARPALPEAQIQPSDTTGRFEIAGETVEIPVELVPLEDPK
jgi:hypothetical protein